MRAGIWSIVLFLCGLGLLAVAGWRYYGPADGPGLIVEEPEREISGCSAGQSKAVSFSFQNRARRPIRIVGLAPC